MIETKKYPCKKVITCQGWDDIEVLLSDDSIMIYQENSRDVSLCEREQIEDLFLILREYLGENNK